MLTASLKLLLISMLIFCCNYSIAEQTDTTMTNQQQSDQNKAQTSDQPKEEIVMDPRVMHYTTCSAFYAISQHAVGDRSPELAKQLEDWSYLASLAALDLIKQTQAADRAEAFFNSFLQATIEGMKAEMKGDLKNIGIITNKYGQQCKELMESSAAVFEKLSKEAQSGKS